MATRARVIIAIQGAAAEEKIGKYGFFEGTYSAILQFMAQKGIVPENIISIDHNGTNYFLFYWK